ncbi:MAG: winged helix-turn-helix transcriptional regulator [Proteobacteria bacterium]|nr:winged helix-turn-helix transcriptional regulator [Pseudomonadota bacterium]
MAHADLVFKALADPHRREILRRLRDGPRSAGELAEAVPLSKATLSHHFKRLKAADLVRSEARGPLRLYALNARGVEEATALLRGVFGPSGPDGASR